MFGIDVFTPIINLPETAILGVGRIKREPVMKQDQVVWPEMVWLSLTFDHRLIDGGPAARFLQRVVELVQPSTSAFSLNCLPLRGGLGRRQISSW